FLFAALEEPGLAPAPAVRAGLVPRPLDRPPDGRVALDRHRAGEEGHLQLVLVEEAQEPPDPGPAPVLVGRLDAEVSVARVHHVVELALALVARIAGRLRVLGALLVVDDEVDRHLGAVRPDDLGRALAVPDEVALRARHVPVAELHQSTKMSSGR